MQILEIMQIYEKQQIPGIGEQIPGIGESSNMSFTQGKHIHQRGSANGKRVQANLAAKNHGVILPDANKENTLNQLCGAAFGAAGQRYVL